MDEFYRSRLADIAAKNLRASALWVAGESVFTNMTDMERCSYLGYHHHAGHGDGFVPGISFLEVREHHYQQRGDTLHAKLSQQAKRMVEAQHAAGTAQSGDLLRRYASGLRKAPHLPYSHHFKKEDADLAEDRLGKDKAKRALRTASSPSASLPDHVDWRDSLWSTAASAVRHQQHCGSCWAIVAASAVEAALELSTAELVRLPVSELVQCVENPRHCGGAGGCDGATTELAFSYLKDHGLNALRSGTEEDLSLLARGAEKCAADLNGPSASLMTSRGPGLVTISGFAMLPQFDPVSLMHALHTHGPVAAGVDGSDFFDYKEGVFDGCSPDAEINHAVLLLGYGVKGQGSGAVPYWLLRNSWGEKWGEAGHMRLLRHEADADAYCGVDRNAQVGIACDGEAKETKVCGMCGVLTALSYPLGAKLHSMVPARETAARVEHTHLRQHGGRGQTLRRSN